MYIQYQNDQFFLHFSVNCSQVAMFQIMPALCPHGQREGGGQPNIGRPGQGDGGSQKFPNLCRHPLWMTPLSLLTGCPPKLTIYGSVLARLLSWQGMVNAGWLSSMQSEIFLQIQFIILHKLLKLGNYSFEILSLFFSE